MDTQVQLMRANVFQIAAHEACGQKRKFSGLPYYTHPQAVAHILQVHVPEATTEMIIAAYLHDTVEDTKMTAETIDFYFGSVVRTYVVGLTNVKVKGMNRAEQKRHDAARLAAEPWAVRVIKLCDRLHNLPDIIANDPAHARVYVPETRYLLDTALVGVHDVLWNKLDAIVRDYQQQNA
jgi:(p)ppGpp synthase/HD superfamily hydrolase